MHEKMPTGLTPGEQEDEAQYAQYMLDHPEIAIAPEDRIESAPEIAEFERMIELFESEHSLAKLHLIVDLTAEEAPRHPVREPARLALIPIVSKLNFLKQKTNILSEKEEELKAKYMRLSRAVGIINNNKVQHDRS